MNRITRRLPRAWLAASMLLLALAAGGCASQPTPDVSTGQALVEIGDALNAVRQDNAMLQSQIDSLRTVVARQDSAITRLNAMVGAVPR